MTGQETDGDDRARRVGVVVIGRNEGERLRRCLASVDDIAARVYVDSGSTDDSVAMARAGGTVVVELAVPPQFTAARARNAGIARLLQDHPELDFVQAIDGDCEVQPGWIAAAMAAMASDDRLAIVFGRRRERFLERSVYNALCDDEWDVPVGEAPACGGDVLMRVLPYREVGGYEPAMIAGEEPDLSMRLRARGWRLRRIDAEMTLHDAAITRFGQWWRRTRRAGHAFAELAHRHPEARWPDWRRICRRIVIWGGVLPAAVVLSLVLAALHRPAWLLAALTLTAGFLANASRIAVGRRRDLSPRMALATGWFLMSGKLPECLGLMSFHSNRLRGRAPHIIEYKGAAAR